MCKSGCHGCPALHCRTGPLAPHDNHSLAEGHRFGPILACNLLLCCWSAHKSLAPRARTLLGVLGQATLNFVAVATLLFCFFCECPKFCDLAKQRRKMFLGVSEVGKIDFALYFFWLCVFFVIFYIPLLRSRAIDRVVAYMRMGMHDRVAARKERAEARSPHWWEDRELVTGKFEKDEFVPRIMDHLANQYDGPIGSDPPTWGFSRVGDKFDAFQPVARNFRRLLVGTATHVNEQGISDEEMSDVDPQEAYTAVKSVVSIPRQAAEEAKENPKVPELKDRLIETFPRLFSGVANKNPPDCGKFGMARIKLKPNRKIYRHQEYQLQGERAEAMKKLLMEFIERGWIEPSDSEWASPAFIVPKKEKGEWRLVVDYRGSNEQTDHDSYSLPLIDSILQKQQKKRIFTVLDLKHGYHQMPLNEDSRPCTAMSAPLGPMQWKVVAMGAKKGNAAFQRMMEDLLQPIRDCADPFVDDIIIGSGTEDMTDDELIKAHEKDLRRVLEVLDKHSMVCKPTKASLFVREVVFAGHVIGHGQHRPMPGKLAALRHWEKP